MWICRRCAAHVKDDVLECPSCATPAPARLQPELANNVSETAEPSPPESRFSLLMNRVMPNVEKQGQRRAVELGAILGFLIPLIGGIMIWAEEFRHAPTVGNFFSVLPIVLISLVAALLFGLLGGLSFGSLHFVMVWFGDLLRWLLGRKQGPQARLPRSALAKTDSLGRPRRRRKRTKKQTGIVDPRQPDRRAILDGKLDIKPEDAGS